jgi:hypothetical protein
MTKYNYRIVLVDVLVCEQFNNKLGILCVRMIIDMIYMLYPFLCFCVDFKTSSTPGNMLILCWFRRLFVALVWIMILTNWWSLVKIYHMIFELNILLHKKNNFWVVETKVFHCNEIKLIKNKYYKNHWWFFNLLLKLHQIVQIASYLISIVTKGGLLWVVEEGCLNFDNIANVVFMNICFYMYVS